MTVKNKNNILIIANQLAYEAHEGQREPITGKPYIYHVCRVVEKVQGDGAKAVAWLHDVLEDSEFTVEDLYAKGIPTEIIAAVELLTRQESDIYADYIKAIKLSGNALALAVKIADLCDHLKPNCPEKLRLRYEKALAYLERKRNDPTIK